MQLVSEQGLESLTVVRLAAELDYTAGALYRYFPSKEALLAQVQRHALSQIHEHLRDKLAALRPDVDDAATRAVVELLAAARFYLDLVVELPQHLKLISRMLADPRPLLSDEEVGQTTAAPFLALIGEVSALFDAAVAAGALDSGNSRDRTVVFWSSLQGIVQLDKMRRLSADLFDPQRLGADLAATLLAGWGADCEHLALATQILETESADASSTH